MKRNVPVDNLVAEIGRMPRKGDTVKYQGRKYKVSIVGAVWVTLED